MAAPAQVGYYLNPTVGDGLSTATARTGYVTGIVQAAGAVWGSCYASNTQRVTKVSSRKSNGQAAGNLHQALQADGNVTYLGSTFAQARTAMQGIDPAIASAMTEAYVAS